MAKSDKKKARAYSKMKPGKRTSRALREPSPDPSVPATNLSDDDQDPPPNDDDQDPPPNDDNQDPPPVDDHDRLDLDVATNLHPQDDVNVPPPPPFLGDQAATVPGRPRNLRVGSAGGRTSSDRVVSSACRSAASEFSIVM